MIGSDVLQIIAEVGAAYAGFGSVVVVFQHRDMRQWPPGDLARFRGLLRLSLMAVLFSLLPLALFHLGVPERTLWSSASAIYAITAGSDALYNGAAMRRDGWEESPIILSFVFGIGAIAVLLLGVNALGIGLDPSEGPYIAALVATLLVASVAFLRLVAYPGKP